MMTANVEYQDAASIFEDACDAFRENFPTTQQEEFKEYRDAQSMISAVQELSDNHPIHRAKLTAAVRKLHKFSRNLEPYFDVVNIFVQANPEYTCLVWGSLRMIFQLSSNYITFLDKICDMFVGIGMTLPAYEGYVNIIQERAQSQGHTYPRLAKALSCVFVDILRFCHSVCQLFSGKSKGLKLKGSFVGRIACRPVTIQYEEILSKLKEHEKLLELEISRASTEEALRFYAKFEEKMLDSELLFNYPNKSATYVESSAAEPRDKEARELQQWVNAPRWADSFEHAQDNRADGTGGWILKDPIFQQWQSRICNPTSTLECKTLSIKAKPGFGKTVLCATMIEHLGKSVLSSESAVEELSPSVMFYFFDERRGAFNSSVDAIRAVLSQLIYLHRANRKVLDEGKRLRALSTTGQQTGTDKETLTMLQHLLRIVQVTFLVFDGLDECSDYPLLLKRIDKAASSSRSCALLLSSRPTVQLSRYLIKNCLSLELTRLENTDDIKCYLLPEIEELIEMEVLPSNQPAEQIVGLIAPRANGMFLWVKLLLEYLRSPILTLKDREDAILNINLLEGLDTLYTTILNSLQSLYPGRSHLKIRRIFQWTTYSQRPLHIEELRAIISTPLDGPQSSEQEIPNLENVLGALTGSLLELGPEKSVQFIHLSALEFFRGFEKGSNELRTPLSKAASYRVGAELYLAAACLSYLYYTVPAKPLSGSPQVTPSAAFVNGAYPFLSYSAQFWPNHFARSLEEIGVSQINSAQGISWNLLAQLATAFINDKSRISMWIEASWLFNPVPGPRIQEVPKKSTMALHHALSSDAAFVPLSKVAESIKMLSDDCAALSKSWHHVLQSEPNEIWEPSIPAFTKSRFWLSAGDAHLVRLAPPQQDSGKCITIQSQLSDSGSRIGVVRLIPPREWIEEATPEAFLHVDWKARYEIWSLQQSKNLCSVEIKLPAKKMVPLLAFKTTIASDASSLCSTSPETEQGEGHTVSLPVAISNDLCSVVILDTVVEIRFLQSEPIHDPTPQPSNSHILFRSQVLDTTTVSSYVPFRTDISCARKSYEEMFHVKFSISRKYLVIIRESTKKTLKGTMLYGDLWWMQVFRDENFSSSRGPNYVCVGLSTFFSVPEISILSPCRGVAFHPTLPRLAFPQVFEGAPKTYIWDFEKPLSHDTGPTPYTNPLPAHEPPVIDPYFSDDGIYLCGTDAPLEFGFSRELRDFCTPVVVEVPEYHHTRMPIFSSKLPSRLPKNGSQTQALSIKAAFDLAHQPKPHVQRANSLVFEQGIGGVVYVTQLHQLEKEGAVVLRTFATNGQLQADTLSRIPNDIRKCVDVSLIHSTATDTDSESKKVEESLDLVHIVLNKGLQRQYKPRDTGNTLLPAVIERTNESIPRFVNTVQILPGAAAGYGKYGSQRLNWRD